MLIKQQWTQCTATKVKSKHGKTKSSQLSSTRTSRRHRGQNSHARDAVRRQFILNSIARQRMQIVITVGKEGITGK